MFSFFQGFFYSDISTTEIFSRWNNWFFLLFIDYSSHGGTCYGTGTYWLLHIQAMLHFWHTTKWRQGFRNISINLAGNICSICYLKWIVQLLLFSSLKTYPVSYQLKIKLTQSDIWQMYFRITVWLCRFTFYDFEAYCSLIPFSVLFTVHLCRLVYGLLWLMPFSVLFTVHLCRLVYSLLWKICDGCL